MNAYSYTAKKKDLIKYCFIVFMLLSILYTILLSFFEINTTSIKRKELETNEKRIVNLEKNMIGKEFKNIISDILFLSDSFNLHSLNKEIYENSAQEWKLFSDRKKIYDQLRFIDAEGNEKIRVNYSAKGAYIVNKEELQNKKDRYYFKDSIDLKKEQIYISKLDLNIENNKIEQPIKPMIRFSTPVIDEAGIVKGIVILNYYAEYLLEDFRNISETSGGELFLLDSNGYWIYNKNNYKEWTFMYEDRKNISFKEEFPVEWENVIKSKEGNIYTTNGLFTFSNIVTIKSTEQNDKNSGYDRIILGEGNWTAVSYVSKNSVNGEILNLKYSKIIISLIYRQKMFFLLILATSIIISILLVFNKIAKEKIKHFSEYDSMTNVLNRRAGFSIINESYQKMMKNKSNMSICFIDINGLKEVNDVLGHDSGDELILAVVDGINKCIRQDDFIIRLGGDEFLVVFLNTDYIQAEQVWDRIKHEYQKVNDEQDKPYLISASHGIEECKFDGNNYIDNIINSADEKMYNEKRQIKKDITIIRRTKM